MRFQRALYPLIIVALICALIAPSNKSTVWAAPALAPMAQDSPADYTFGDCSEIDKENLRNEIETVAHDALSAESAKINIDAIVIRQWVAVDMDSAIDAEVERAVNEIYDDEGYWSRLWSGWSAEKAEEYATRIAASAFSSESFQAQIEALSLAIANEIARDIEANFARAASVAFLCMRAYVGDHYSGTLFRTFEEKVSTEVDTVDIAGSGDAVDVSALEVHSKALGGVGLIVVTEISRRIALRLSEKIAERIAGKIIGRVLGKAGTTLIPVAGWVIGLGLIVWDLWEGGNGALPQIRDALQSEEVKAKVRQEVSEAVKGGLPEELSIVSLEIAVSLVEEWNQFCDTNRAVCTLADSNGTFQDILEYTPLDQVNKVVALVNLFVNRLGNAALDEAFGDGRFEKLLTLPESAFSLLTETQSIDEVLAWRALAGDQLERAIALGITDQKSPEDFDATLMKALLNLDDQAAIDKLLPLDRATLTDILTFADANFIRLAHRLSTEELQQLGDYLSTTTTVPDDLASALAGGSITVASLAEANTIDAMATEPTIAPNSVDFAAVIAPIWQFIYANSIVVVSLLVLCLALGIGFVGTMQGRRRKKQSPQATAKSKQKRRKRRDPYDIFDDDR